MKQLFKEKKNGSANNKHTFISSSTLTRYIQNKYIKFVVVLLIILITPVIFMIFNKYDKYGTISFKNLRTPTPSINIPKLQYTAFPFYSISPEEETEFITLGYTLDHHQVLLNYKTTKLKILDNFGEKDLSVILGQNKDLSGIKMAALTPINNKTNYIAILGLYNPKTTTTPLFIFKLQQSQQKFSIELLRIITIPQYGQYVKAGQTGEFWVSSIYNIFNKIHEYIYSDDSVPKSLIKELDKIPDKKSNILTHISIKSDQQIKIKSIPTQYDYMPSYWDNKKYTILTPFSPIDTKQLAIYNNTTDKVLVFPCSYEDYIVNEAFDGSNVIFIKNSNNCKLFNGLHKGLAQVHYNPNDSQNPIIVQNISDSNIYATLKIKDIYSPIELLNYHFFTINNQLFAIDYKNKTLSNLTQHLKENIDFLDPDSDHYVLDYNTVYHYIDIIANNATILRVFNRTN